MKFTSEDLMKAMGLQVEDRIKVNDEQLMTVFLNDCGEIKLIEDYIKVIFPIEHLLNRNVEILPRPKRVGDEYCKNINCNKCPLRIIDCMDSAGDKMRDKTLYEILHYQNEVYPDKEIYDLLKARLDKEVE